MTEKRKVLIFWIIFYLAIFCVLLTNTFYYLDADLGWHLVVGNETLSTQQVPHANYYNYTIKSENWVDHEWLSNALMAWIFNHFGYEALSLIFVFIILIFLILQNYFIQKYIANKYSLFIIGFFQLLGVIATRPHLGIRVQEISLLFLSLLLLIIYAYEKENRITTLPMLVPLFFLWANLHGAFLIGFFVLGVWLGTDILLLIIKKYSHFSSLNLRKVFIAGFFCILAFLATLVTPYRLELYSFLSGYTDSFYVSHIQEWLPIFSSPIIYWQLLYLALFLGFLCIIILNYFKLIKLDQRQKETEVFASIPLWHWILILVFIALAIKSKRHFPLFFIISFPVIILSVKYLFELPEKINFKKILNISFLVSTILLVAIGIFQINRLKIIEKPFEYYCKDNPCGAVEFLKQDPRFQDLRILNQYGWGGFLIYSWPGKKLYIDGRLPQVVYNDHSLLEDYYQFMDEDTLAEKIDHENIELILIQSEIKPVKLKWFEKLFFLMNEEKINSAKFPLRDHLTEDPAWQLLYNDKIARVYVRKSAWNDHAQ